jgi:predicted alpha/beta superfamily hydrolase
MKKISSHKKSGEKAKKSSEIFMCPENIGGGTIHSKSSSGKENSKRSSGGGFAAAVFILALILALQAVFLTGAAGEGLSNNFDGGIKTSREEGGATGRQLPGNLIITVKVPESTPAGDKIYITGGHETMGGWKADGAGLIKISEYSYKFEARVEKNCAIEFKFTRGSFDKVEKDAKGHEIPNRRLFFDSGAGVNKIDCTIEGWADLNADGASAAPKPPKITGNFEIIKKFKSKILNNERDIIVLLPPSYFSKLLKNHIKRYPVLYMHDGNNLFDPNTSFQGVDWGIDEACAKLYKTGAITELIVVAVCNNTERMNEYTPFKDPKHGGGGGDKYLRFLIEELMPHIDSKFRTLTGAKNTAIGGSSLGGLISLYAAAEYSDKFSKAIVMSPSIWWAEGKIIDFVIQAKLDSSKTRIWMDMGLAEGEEGLSYTRKFNAGFNKKYPGFKSYRYEEFPDAPHNETAWRARIEFPLKYMFSK